MIGTSNSPAPIECQRQEQQDLHGDGRTRDHVVELAPTHDGWHEHGLVEGHATHQPVSGGGFRP